MCKGLLLYDGQGPVSLRFFHHNSNSMEISFHSHLDSNTVIATKLCTWHDSCAVVACAKNCCDLMASNRVMARRSFHRIWIAGKKTLVKRDPGPDGIAAKWNFPRIWIVMEKTSVKQAPDHSVVLWLPDYTGCDYRFNFPTPILSYTCRCCSILNICDNEPCYKEVLLYLNVDGLVQERRNSSVSAMELRTYCT